MATSVGNLKNALTFWEKDLQASPYVLHIIREGYKIPFYSLPPPSQEKNNASSIRDPYFVEKELHTLLQDDRILEADAPPHTPLTH